ncbi:MAG: type II toxin-antitoxin system RelE/ParE family toxin [Nitrospirae bacterium]|nr:type II toxin-antitoxin system RelE/ParE family toxin [Nitrospirota bacterium]
MPKIKWSKDSIDNIKEITTFIAKDSPYYAKLFRDRIFEMIEHLEFFPEIGRLVPELNDPNIKELIFNKYRIIYQINEDYIEIISILHGSRLLQILGKN